MKRRHVAIINVPGPVHVHPTLTVVAALVRRGYLVTYVTSGRFAATIAAQGAHILHCPRFEFPYNQNHGAGGTPIDRQYSTDLTDLAARTLSLVSPFYEGNTPDLILYDTYAFAGPVLSKRLSVPAIRMTCHLAHDEENLKLSIVPPRLRRSLTELCAQADRFFESHAIPPRQSIFNRVVPTVYFYLRNFQLSQTDGEDALYAARCAAERPYSFHWKCPFSDNRKLVLISASTTYVQGPEYYKFCLESLADLDVNVVLSTGPVNDIETFGPLPPNCRIAQNIPQLSIMPHADLMICTGGLTTTMEALYHGLPLIMLTHGHSEVEMYAQNVYENGMGIHLRCEDGTAENIRRSVTLINSDTSLHDRVKEAQKTIRKSGGGDEVANWIEDCTWLRGKLAD